MKRRTAPSCPRCNSSHAVQQLVDGLPPAKASSIPIREGFTLGGRCIRPESPDWYCNACAESFGVSRQHWGDPLTGRIQ